jgi:hypothetical protein
MLKYQEEICYKTAFSTKRRDNDFIRVHEEVLETQSIDSNRVVVVSHLTRLLLKPYPIDESDDKLDLAIRQSQASEESELKLNSAIKLEGGII